MNESFIFRLMTENDIDQVLVIERNSFTTPWSKEAFYNEMTKNQFAYYIVIEDQEKVVGYCGVWVVLDEGHITNIAILPEYRGRKLGEKLMTKIMNLGRELGANKLTLEVRKTNYVAQKLYKKLGFEEGAIRKNYYTDNQEDALVMWVNL